MAGLLVAIDATTTHFTLAERRLWPKLVRALRESVSRYFCVQESPSRLIRALWPALAHSHPPLPNSSY
jgi:hypothetical protein